MIPELQYSASGRVSDAVAALGRTEDVRFSPGNHRLAVAGYGENRVVVFDVRVDSSPSRTEIVLTGGVDLSSPAFHSPHGVAFVDDDTLVVTSRERDLAIFRLPPGERDVPAREVSPVAWTGSERCLEDAPGSVSVSRLDADTSEILVCDNAANSVTRHLVDRRAVGVVKSSEVLLGKHLSIPDGVTVSPDRRWIAVSNHKTHNVLMYERSPKLCADSDPDGILRRVYYPHGLCFSADGRYLFVADAGAPYLHIYARHVDEWRGVRHPVASVRVMQDSVFHRGRYNQQEGGPKGLAISADSNVLVLTAEHQPLTFFDVSVLLQHALDGDSPCDRAMLDLDHELALMDDLKNAAAEAAALRNSTSWRLTAPLRRLGAAFRR